MNTHTDEKEEEMIPLSKTALNQAPSGIRKMFELAKEYDNVINLCIGEPGFPTAENIINACKEGLDKGYTKYTSNAGIDGLRKELARKLKRENGISADPDTQIIVTAGGVEAVLLTILTTVSQGDEVLVPTPCWPNYSEQIKIAGGIMVPVPCLEKNGFVPQAVDIEQKITDKTKVLILNSPCNPTGAMIPEEELWRIRDIVLKYNLTVISDQPYERLVYDGRRAVSIGALPDMDEHTVTVNTFSKTYAMSGWRVGYGTGPAHVIAEMVKLKEQTSSSVNASAQYACIEALKNSELTIQKMLEGYTDRRKILIDGLNECKGVHCLYPAGAFYAFANIESFGVTAEELAIDILQKVQVVVTPGTAFGEAGEGFIRMSFASSEEELREAVKRLKNYFNEK